MADSPSASGLDPTLQLVSFHNDTIPTGGDSKIDNLNVFYNVMVYVHPEHVRLWH